MLEVARSRQLARAMPCNDELKRKKEKNPNHTQHKTPKTLLMDGALVIARSWLWG